MAGTRVYWVHSPLKLAREVKGYGDKLETAVKALADYIATMLQNDMRKNAPWNDRTGNARTGLFSVAEKASKDVVDIYLSHGHTVEYGKWLELANGGRYAIIMPTIEKNLPTIKRMLKELLR